MKGYHHHEDHAVVVPIKPLEPPGYCVEKDSEEDDEDSEREKYERFDSKAVPKI